MTIEERLEKMEMKMKRNNRILLAVLLLGVLIIAAGTANRKDVIKASSFDLIDENGKIRATLDVSKDGPRLRLFDENEKPRAALFVSKVMTGLSLGDENGKSRATLGVSKDMTRLSLGDENGKSRATLDVFKDGPVLQLLDENEKPRAVLGRDKTATRDGKVINYPESSLLMFDPNERVIWSAP